jgi:16S rRNA (guanine(527)-N(7))-methyltransferase RsmG
VTQPSSNGIDFRRTLRALIASLADKAGAEAMTERLSRFASLIREWNERGNLVSRGDAERLLTRHIPESLEIAARVRELSPASVLDLGSGAGLPGIPIALMHPTAVVVLLESRRMKSLFLLRAIQELELENCFAWCARAESIGAQIDSADSSPDPLPSAAETWSRLSVDPPQAIPTFELVTARAVAPLPELVALAEPLTQVGGHLLTAKGSRVAEEMAAWESNPGPWILEAGPTPLKTPGAGPEGAVEEPNSPQILVLRRT